ncbi:30S ribosomal protein S6 [Kaistella flava (ex Peng et al. 2021)]|uniref:30S ribosomal protein S6 n=1 Tax=Kaistella flava (ex Peng et al. 2021) TaxID=2038776 RepID=A0A7M2YBQ6_9FLAO|nr:GYDIA family GHMP kinase [Kaistella flava (ex Peng et al. 2021)]QOW10862.1 30S ribosomal protein S6 [Kaistella flava (ex Peng et al. 2021)]
MIFSHGKLLLTSEYVVLDGALALALPTKWGQEFFVSDHADGKSLVNWTALHKGKSWLNATIDYRTGKVVSTNIPESAAFILKVLMKVKEVSAIQLKQDSSYSITTDLQFPANFGLGSSSTLMNNLAQWAAIDAFELNETCLGGSGYDIAVAQEQSAILYQNQPERIVHKIDFNPSYTKDLIFIHLNQKQNSREGINLYRSKEKSPELIEEFSGITRRVLEVQNLECFSELMTLHENKLSDFLGIETVKEKHFENCPSFVKSLGAWGGDFVMSSKFSGYEDYFSGKGFSTVFTYQDLIY